jgi:3',5'-cyclic AMP phosphodiesterase CpdA
VAELRTACNDDTQSNLTAIRRQAYLQQVTMTGALVGWVTTKPAGAHVKLTDPNGALVEMKNGVVEKFALRTPDENQIWTTLDRLSTHAVYCYQLGDTSGELTARTGFRTAPAADDPAPVRFLAFGDSGGGGADQHALLEQMYTVPFDLMIHTGDLAYDSGTVGQYEDTVFAIYADLFRNVPFFPAAGNHDYRTDDGAPFRGVFNLPSDEKWYSYDWGRVHFAALDTESSYRKQAEWLDRDLEKTKLPWKIVYLHKPPYSSGAHGSDRYLRGILAPVLERHHVQLVLAGHDHDYERIKPQHGVTYVVTGGGGKGTRSVGSSSFTAFSEGVIHFVYGEVDADKLVLHAIDGSGTEFDSVVINR